MHSYSIDTHRPTAYDYNRTTTGLQTCVTWCTFQWVGGAYGDERTAVIGWIPAGFHNIKQTRCCSSSHAQLALALCSALDWFTLQ